MLHSSLRTLALSAVFLADSFSLSAQGHDEYTYKDLNEQSVLAATWMQSSGEFKAL